MSPNKSIELSRVPSQRVEMVGGEQNNSVLVGHAFLSTG